MMTPTPTPGLRGSLRVAYTVESNVWLWAQGSQATPLTHSGDVGENSARLSDDGTVVAFARGHELWAINEDGTGERKLVSQEDFDAMQPTDPGVSMYRYDWVPGTHTLALNTRLRKQFVTDPTDDLHLIDADTLAHTALLPPGEGGSFYYSPDGSQVAIVRSGTIDLIDADGGTRRQAVLTYTPSEAFAEVRYYAEPTWAADGTALGVTIAPPDPYAQPAQQTTVWYIPTDGRTGRLVASITAAPTGQIVFAPDLAHVAYLRFPGDTLTSDPPNLVITELNDTGPSSGETVTYDTSAWLFYGWAPGAEHFAFTSVTGVDAQPVQAQIGKLGYDAVSIESGADIAVVLDIRWIDDARFFALAKSADETEWLILLGEMGRASAVIASIPELPGMDIPSYDLADLSKEAPIVATPTPVPTPVPRLSALHVAYIQDGDVWLWIGGPAPSPDQETKPVQLTSGGGTTDVRVSGDGEAVAFVREGELWAIDANGTGERKLVSEADLAAIEPREVTEFPTVLYVIEWVPGTHVVAYNTRLDFPIGLVPNDDLHLVDADTLARTLLLAPGQGGAFYYSPDGRQVAIANAGGISLFNADGQNMRDVLTYTPVATASEHRYYAQPVWAADASSLRVAIPPADPFAQPPQPTTIWYLPTDETSANLMDSIVVNSPPAFSPDLQYVAYLEQPEGAKPGHTQGKLIVRALVDGTTVVQYPQAIDIYGWSSDSQYWAFLSNPESPRAQIGQIGTIPMPAYDDTDATTIDVRWVDATHYLFLEISHEHLSLLLGEVGGPSELLVTVPGRSLPYDWAY